MAIQFTFDSEDEIPDIIKENYSLDEATGKYTLQGFAPKEQYEAERRKAENIRADKEKAQKALRDIVGDKSASDVKELLKKFESGQVKTAVKDENLSMAEFTDLKVKFDTRSKEYETLSQELERYKTKERENKIEKVVLEACKKHNVAEKNIDDALRKARFDLTIDEKGNVHTNDDNFYSPEAWLSKQQQEGRGWWAEPVGGGAKGAFGSSLGINPWSNQNWNETEQTRFYRQHGHEKSEQMARSAGTQLGGIRPIK